jgi:hypothetical protein
MTGVLRGRETVRCRHTQREDDHVMTKAEIALCTTSQGLSRIATVIQIQKRQESFLPRAFQRIVALLTPFFPVQMVNLSVKNKYCICKEPSFW